MRDAVLVIDDEPAITDFVAIALGHDGFHVVQINGGGDAIGLLSRDPEWAAILLDVAMPGVSGNEVLEFVVKAGILCPVVLMTGNLDSFRDEMQSRILSVLQKPFGAEQVVAAVRQAKGATP